MSIIEFERRRALRGMSLAAVCRRAGVPYDAVYKALRRQDEDSPALARAVAGFVDLEQQLDELVARDDGRV